MNPQSDSQGNAGYQRLLGKRIIVTAAASGMGRAGAELFAKQGAIVCVVDYNVKNAAETAEGIKAAGGKASVIVADLQKESEAKRIIHDAAGQMGGIDAIWAHAGSPSPRGIENLDFDAYHRCMNINVNSTVASVSEVVPYLKKSGGGAILLTASVSGLVGSLLSPIYSLAKFGLVGLAKSLAITLGPNKIRVNVLCPGTVETPMLPDFMPDAARAKFVETLPLGRIADPIEIAHAALWLLSDEASYVTGVALPVDGGFTAR